MPLNSYFRCVFVIFNLHFLSSTICKWDKVKKSLNYFRFLFTKYRLHQLQLFWINQVEQNNIISEHQFSKEVKEQQIFSFQQSSLLLSSLLLSSLFIYFYLFFLNSVQAHKFRRLIKRIGCPMWAKVAKSEKYLLKVHLKKAKYSINFFWHYFIDMPQYIRFKKVRNWLPYVISN